MWPQHLLAPPTKVRRDGFKKAAVEEEEKRDRQTDRQFNHRQVDRKMVDAEFDAEFEDVKGKK